MKSLGGSKGAGKSLGRIVLRALGSTVVIGGAVLAIVSVRSGAWRWGELKSVFLGNRAFWVMIFFALVIWDGWFERSRRRRD